MVKKKQSIQDKVNSLEKEILALEAQYGLTSIVSLDFPRYKVLPKEVELAILILEKHEPKFVRTYKEN